MDNKLKVSVIMPIYNAAEFLRAGLDSLQMCIRDRYRSTGVDIQDWNEKL